MDDKRVSSTEIASVVLNDAFQDSKSSNCKVHKCHLEKRDDTRNEGSIQDVIDRESIPMIYIETSDEDDVSERFSGDVERTETQLPLMTDLESSIGCGREFASLLHERTQKLWTEMTSLREKLNKETALWKKKKEEFQFLRERSDAIAFEEATAAARAAAAAYAVESPLSSDLGNIVDLTLEPSIRELMILEYEKNLAKYHDRHSLEQAEQRYNSYKRVLVDAYKQKLSEVERLCDEELENIQQNASCLQPFKEIASQWSIDENDHGDSHHGCDNQSEPTEPSKIESSPSNDWCIYGKLDNEVNMTPEILSVRFKRDETT
ncbi:PREDICTED: uncharacterized protein LOC108783501 [Cyphomyrmex costatus]|uniref:Uncharacterized protein n=1 Tax=Cyphomyrmex costatus TaxID=456900 RepID=A0A151IM10_9HYME|nr:PREDICTED: uncharacterized protein LOC108783501 [Cyphomyrmex costatus]KYN05903.1 hypothetical protein ALC62_03172 [Cyphomyrmex costatus]